MKLLLDSYLRAVAYCLHPRVIFLSVLPVLLIAGTLATATYFFWVPAQDAVSSALEASALLTSALKWLEGVGMGGFRTVLPMIVMVAVMTPVIVIVCLLCASVLMSPMLVKLVAKRRFASLAKQGNASIWMGVAWSLGSCVLALVALVLSIPLWLIPPLVMIIPPLIWGWLAYRVMAFDAISAYASRDERRALFAQHRFVLLGMGLVTGYLSAAPSLVWSFFAAVVMAPFLIVISVWIYMLVFTFSTLWFTHYGLAALQALRQSQSPLTIDAENPHLS